MMERRKLKFAMFGNVYQEKKSAAIQQVLTMLSVFGAELYVDQEYYEFLLNHHHADLDDVKVFEGDDFNADFVISMGGVWDSWLMCVPKISGAASMRSIVRISPLSRGP